MMYHTKLSFEAKQINQVHSLNARNTFNKYYTDFETCKFLISNNSLAIEFIIHYFLDVTYIPSCMSGSRNFKMAKLEEPRHVGKPVAHMDMGKKMNIFMSHFLQVYIQTNLFITLSLMRNELYILVNCHPN